MAINFHAKVQICGIPQDHKLCKPRIPNRKEATKLKATIAFQPIHKTKRIVGSKLFEFGSHFDSSQKAVVQDLVDHLHWCAENRLLAEAKVIHGYVIKSDVDDQNLLILLNHVMYAYLKSSDFKSAKVVYNYLQRKNVFSWSVMIVGFNQQASFEEGFTSFSEMMEHGISPDGFAYSSVIQSCIGMGRVDLGDMVHAQIIIRGFGLHVVVSTALLSMYAKLGKVEDACRVFNSMAEHNDISWNAMISGLTTNGLHLEAFDIFLKMMGQGFTPDMLTLVSVLKAVGMLGDIDKGRQVHKCISELGMQDNIRVGTALIDMYAKCGDLLEARSVFDTNFAFCLLVAMLVSSRKGSNTSSPWRETMVWCRQWSTTLVLLSRVGRLHEAFECIKKMAVEPDGMGWYGRPYWLHAGFMAAKKILSFSPEHSSTYVLLANTYMETGSLKAMKEAGYSWISVEGRVHRFYAGDTDHPQKDCIYAKLEPMVMFRI